MNSPFRILSIIHIALIVGLLTFFGVIMYLRSLVGNLLPDTHEAFHIVQQYVHFIAIVFVGLGYILYNIVVKKAIALNELPSKVVEYRKASIMRWAMFEAGAMLCLIGYWATGNVQHLIVYLVVMIFFFIYRPSKYQFSSNFQLNEEQDQQVQNM